MHRAFWRTRESLRMFFIGLATVIVFISGRLWPRYEFAIWAVFLIAVALYICLRLRQPVNYKSIVISEEPLNMSDWVAETSSDQTRSPSSSSCGRRRSFQIFTDT